MSEIVTEKSSIPFDVAEENIATESKSPNELKTVAHYFGYSDDYIDFLMNEGYSIGDIEEVLY